MSNNLEFLKVFSVCPDNKEFFKNLAFYFNYQYSLETSLAFTLMVFLLYNVCKYLYNQPSQSKDRLTITLFALFFLNILCKSKHRITIA